MSAMNILITGPAGNLGGHLTRYLLDHSGHHLNLLVHEHEPPAAVASHQRVTIHRADLARPETLIEPCRETGCIVHFAGTLFEPRPEKFLPTTNTTYVRNLVDAALAAGVKKFIIISFPHVEGESSPARPARGNLDGNPDSVHARTRLAAEKCLFTACEDTDMVPVALRPGMIYSRGILMPDAARWLARHHLLAVWKRPTWIHLMSLPDFLAATRAAIEQENVTGIYNLGDDGPLTLQEFLDRSAARWGCRRPWRAPRWSFYAAAALTEAFATVFRTRAPLTRDFIRIGMASYTADTSRMKAELLPKLQYPTLSQGIVLL